MVQHHIVAFRRYHEHVIEEDIMDDLNNECQTEELPQTPLGEEDRVESTGDDDSNHENQYIGNDRTDAIGFIPALEFIGGDEICSIEEYNIKEVNNEGSVEDGNIVRGVSIG